MTEPLHALAAVAQLDLGSGLLTTLDDEGWAGNGICGTPIGAHPSLGAPLSRG